MRSAVWLLGLFQLIIGAVVMRANAPAWSWVWWCAAVVWFFVGCALLASWLVHLIKPRLSGVKFPGQGKNSAITPPAREEK